MYTESNTQKLQNRQDNLDAHVCKDEGNSSTFLSMFIQIAEELDSCNKLLEGEEQANVISLIYAEILLSARNDRRDEQ